MLKTRILLVLTALVFSTLACMAAERLIFGDPAQEDYSYAPETQPQPAPPESDDPQPAPAQETDPYAQADCPNGDCVIACMEGLDSVLAPSAANALRHSFTVMPA